MRFQAEVKVVVSEDDDQLQRIGPDVDVVLDDSGLSTFTSGVVVLAPGGPEHEFAFEPEVTEGKYILLRVVNGSVNIKLNADDQIPFGLTFLPPREVDPILPYQKVPQAGMLLLGPLTKVNPITKLYLSNQLSGGEDLARIFVAVVGEPV